MTTHPPTAAPPCQACNGTGIVPAVPWHAAAARRPGYTRPALPCQACGGSGHGR